MTSPSATRASRPIHPVPTRSHPHRRAADRSGRLGRQSGPLDLLAKLTLELVDPLWHARHALEREGGADLARRHLDRVTGVAEVMRELAELDPTPTLGGDFQSVRIAEVHAAALEGVDIELLGRGVRVELSATPPVPLLTDPRAASAALRALIENACHHSPEGGTVCVSATVGGDGSEVRIAVEDQGPGIHPDDRELVFEAFMSASGPDGRAGLGLTVARTLARQLGGEVTIEVAGGGGARVVLGLPALTVPRVRELVVEPALEWARTRELAASTVLVHLAREWLGRTPDYWPRILRSGLRRSDRVIAIDDDLAAVIAPLGPRQMRALERRMLEIMGRAGIPAGAIWMDAITHPAPGVTEEEYLGRTARMLARGMCGEGTRPDLAGPSIGISSAVDPTSAPAR